MLVKDGHQAAFAVKVDNWHAPNLAAATDGCSIILDVQACEVGVHFIGLHVAGAKPCVCPVERSHQDYLLSRESRLELTDEDVASAAEGLFVIVEMPVQLGRHHTVGIHRVDSFCEPLSHRHVVEEVIGAGQDYDGVEAVVKLEGLSGQLVHPGAVDGEGNGLHIHQFCKEFPPAFVGPDPDGVANGIAEDCNLATLPLALGGNGKTHGHKAC